MGVEYTCIVCPLSCRVSVEETAEGLKISGYSCKRGEAHARNEHTNPRRMLTSTVRIKGAQLPRLPVISSEEIPRVIMKECLDVIYQTTVTAPVMRGEVIIPDICGSGIDILASRSLSAVK